MTNAGTVLVVDDTLASLKLLAALLSGEGYQVRPADSGPLALASVAANPPELILLDIRMPGMDGFEVIRQLKANPKSRDIPVIFLSAVTEVELRVEGLKLGAVDFISKPFQREELLARVKTHIELRRLRTRSENQAVELTQANDRLELEIADHKKDEEALRESEERYRSLYADSRDAVMIVAPDRGFLAANPATIQLFACKNEQEFTAHTPASLSPEFQPDGARSTEKAQKMMHLALEMGSHFFEWTHRRVDGTDFPATVLLSRLESGGTRLLQATVRDITEQKRAEDALRQANKQLNLLSSITRHDILNQLMALKGYLELSHEMIDNPTTLIEYIKKEEMAANTIEHQITFTKNYQELGVTPPEWQNVNASIKKAVASLPMREVRVDVDPNNPEIFADRLFEKVFYNLIDNALRYGGADMKTIRVSSQKRDACLSILCEDDGVGISAEDKKKLFTRGFGKHTGLGLFLSREILAITGITIAENGVPGKGARFEITVPKGAWRMAGAQG